jgi:BMFP domain-containing protein YqiC
MLEVACPQQRMLSAQLPQQGSVQQHELWKTQQQPPAPFHHKQQRIHGSAASAAWLEVECPHQHMLPEQLSQLGSVQQRERWDTQQQFIRPSHHKQEHMCGSAAGLEVHCNPVLPAQQQPAQMWMKQLFDRIAAVEGDLRAIGQKQSELMNAMQSLQWSLDNLDRQTFTPGASKGTARTIWGGSGKKGSPDNCNHSPHWY